MNTFETPINNNQSILIVDDDDSTLKTLSAILKKKSFIIEIASNGNEALEKVNTGFFNIALIDLMLPDMRGIDLIKPFFNRHPDIGIILITGNASLETATQALNNGASAYIMKPVDIDELIVKIKNVIEKQSLVTENRRLYESVQNELNERIKAEQSLLKERNLLNRIMSASPVGIFMLDKNEKLTFANEHTLKIFRLEEEKTLGKSPYSILNEVKDQNGNPISEDQMPFTIVSKTKKPYNTIFNITYNGDQKKTISINTEPLLDNMGVFEGVVETIEDVTSRLEMQEKIKKSEEIYRMLFDNAPIGYHEVDKNGKIIRINKTGADLLGYAVEEMVGKLVFDFVDDTEKEIAKSYFKDKISGKIQLAPFERKYVKKDGTVIYVLIKEDYLKNKDQKTTGFLTVVTDITERKNMINSLHWESTVNKTLAGISNKLISSNANISQISETFLESAKKLTESAYGYIGFIDKETESFLTSNISYDHNDECNVDKKLESHKFVKNDECLFPSLRGVSLNNKKGFYKNNPESDENTRGFPEGQVKINNFLSVPAIIGDEIVGQIFLANKENNTPYNDRDLEAVERITELYSLAIQRIRSEERLFEYSQNLEVIVEERTSELNRSLNDTEEARDRMDGILKSVSEGIVVTDVYSRIVLMNRAAEDMLNVRLCEVINRPINSVMNNEQLLTRLKETFSSDNKEKFDLKIENKNGRNNFLQAITSSVYDKYGNKSGIVMSFHDVTEEREIDRMKTEFISTAAHELRSPLTSILGFSELLIERDNISTTDQKKMSIYINRQATNLSKIVNDLLDISRIESGKGLELDKEIKNVREIAENVVAVFKETYKTHRFIIEFPEKGNELFIDSEKIEEVFNNIISNAVKYSPNGGDVLIKGERNGKFFTISIKDHGIGMTSKEVERIFEKFYRADSSNSAIEGTGLGMSIVKYLVDEHGGDVYVDSTPDIGTKVTFTIPL